MKETPIYDEISTNQLNCPTCNNHHTLNDIVKKTCTNQPEEPCNPKHPSTTTYSPNSPH